MSSNINPLCLYITIVIGTKFIEAKANLGRTMKLVTKMDIEITSQGILSSLFLRKILIHTYYMSSKI